MTLPTEPIGSIPRSPELQAGMQAAADGRLDAATLDALFDEAVRDTVARFEATGSPIVTDGEQRKPSFATYPIAGLTTLAPGGVTIPFADGHTRQLPVITAGPFRYTTKAYYHAIRHAARKADARARKQAIEAGMDAEEANARVFVPCWHPNQLRHTHATEVRKRFGLEAAQVALGHANANTTELYAERNMHLAVEVASKIG